MAETPHTQDIEIREVIEALIKNRDLHEGVWQLVVNFGLAGTNAGPNDMELRPAALVGIMKMGLMKAEKESGVALDAAKVNPSVTAKEKRRQGKKK